jgi:hypothetical protein
VVVKALALVAFVVVGLAIPVGLALLIGWVWERSADLPGGDDD